MDTYEDLSTPARPEQARSEPETDQVRDPAEIDGAKSPPDEGEDQVTYIDL